ncbi:MAG: DUF3035 domain-containing protein [Gemmobacter sp.]
MQAGRGTLAVAVLALLTLVACGGEPRLMNLRSSTDGPDEFAILPPKALELPESLVDLPEPTPGGVNLTDPRPNDDAVAALGGRPGAGSGGDAGLMNHATRYGISSGIRTQLAAEDLEFRSKNRGRPLERLFNLNVYFRAYRKQSLDQYAELERWRRAGARNPSAPPDN